MTGNRHIDRRLFVPLGLVCAAVAALAVDLPIAQTVRSWERSPLLSGGLRFFDMFESFGYGLGVIVLVLAIHQLDPDRRWAIPRVLACAFGAGILADVLKLVIFRVRPHSGGLDGTVWSTFGEWFPLLGIGSSGQSFPSAHTATAVGFAAALIWLYPQGRLLFSTLAVLVGCQRIACGAHYLSDVLIGAAAGCLTAQALLTLGRLPRWFERLEAKSKRPNSPAVRAPEGR
jgi:membrane-associated phospholipid phosphatase